MPSFDSWVLLLAVIQRGFFGSLYWPTIFRLLFYVFIFVALLALIVSVSLGERPRISDTLAHWHVTIPQLRLSPESFYEELSKHIDQPTKGIPLSVRTIHLSEGSFIAYHRPYLRVRQVKLDYYVFAAPLGKSLFISSWLVIRRPFLSRILPHLPLIGWFMSGIGRLFESDTFFTYDSALYFLEMTHTGLLQTIDKLTQAGNLESLPLEIRKPVMRELYAKPAAPQLPLPR
jgi:hypothetical protein